MRKTKKQLEQELAAAKAEAEQWKAAHRALADAFAAQRPYYLPYTFTYQPVTSPTWTYTNTDFTCDTPSATEFSFSQWKPKV